MWTPPLSYDDNLQDQLEEAGVRLDADSIKFWIQFTGGHRGIFMAAMRWVQQKQQSGAAWDLQETIRMVRESYGTGSWSCGKDEILGRLRQCRAVRVNGKYSSLHEVPREFVDLICKGSDKLPANVCRDLSFNGFVLPQSSTAEEFEIIDWTDMKAQYHAANPLLAAYYFHVLKEEKGLQVQYDDSKPQHAADLLLRALPSVLFHVVVGYQGKTSQLGADGLPAEDEYNTALLAKLKEMKYQAYATQTGGKDGKPDIALEIDGKRFVLEGMKSSNRQDHLERFNLYQNYKGDYRGLYIIGRDDQQILATMEKLDNGDVQLIGLVPNLPHTAYTVHVKDENVACINSFVVPCDLVARRLVLNDDGQAELHPVQALLSVNLSPPSRSKFERKKIKSKFELSKESLLLLAVRATCLRHWRRNEAFFSS